MSAPDARCGAAPPAALQSEPPCPGTVDRASPLSLARDKPPPRRPRRLTSGPAWVMLSLLGLGTARLLFYPTLLYTLVRERLPGSRRPWFSRIDHAVLLGALPLRGRCRQLVEEENVRGVVSMNEEYETRFLCCSPQEWEAMGVEYLRLSTVDLTGVPSLENLHKGVQFILKHSGHGNSVYVHCKAGRVRSATMVAAYLIQLHQWTAQEAIEAIAKIRPHIIIRKKQVQLLEDFYKSVTVETPAKQEPPKTEQGQTGGQQSSLGIQKKPENTQDATCKSSDS